MQLHHCDIKTGMVNYYEILGIGRNSTAQQVKKSFRKRAKEIHPDLNRDDSASSQDRMRQLLSAYEVLSDLEKRIQYDRALNAFISQRGFDYRDFLKSRKDDFRSQSKLIFHDLLTNHQAEAVDLYETLTITRGLDLEKFMPREDYMDCAFLLAEVYESRGKLAEAYELYKKLYLYEQQAPYFNHFIEEIIDRLRSLICFRMIGTFSFADSIRYLNEAIMFDFSRKDNAFFYKKLAEVYSTLGETDQAVKCLQNGLQLDHKLPGVKKLMERLGYSVCLDNR
jgi:curved DNA-binding protein CbpA